MKKLMTLSLALTGFCLSSVAADFTVYKDGNLFPDAQVQQWWNGAWNFTAIAPEGTTPVFEFSQGADNPKFGCMGLAITAENDFIGKLATATLNFRYYATGTGTYTIRLVSKNEQDYNFTVTEENVNTWQTLALPVATNWPTISTQWEAYEKDGEGCLFGIVSDLADATSIYFSEIYYSDINEAWTAPEVEEVKLPAIPTYDYDAADVKSLLSGQYTPAAGFSIGGWGQSTSAKLIMVDDNPVEALSYFNYLGWELEPSLDITDCNYMHVDFYTTNCTEFAFTPISPGLELIWNAPTVTLNEWNSYDVPLSYFSNVNMADVFQVKFLGGNGDTSDGYIANVFFYKKDNGGDEPEPEPVAGATYSDVITSSVTQEMTPGEPKTYPYTITYDIIYNEDQTLTINARYNWSDGEPIGIVPGSVFINNQLNDFTQNGDNLTVTTTTTYTAGTIIPVNFYRPMALGVVQNEIMYEVGSIKTMGISEVETDETATVEYYNLQGVRVANPENGIFIRRQGNKVSKVIL